MSKVRNDKKTIDEKSDKNCLNISKNTATFSITFGDVAENHNGMQKIGNLAENGINIEDLKRLGTTITKTYDLKKLLIGADIKDIKDVDDAKLAIIKNGVDILLGDGSADKLFEELKNYKYDKKAYMRGRVVNKIARWNNCFADYSQSADYANGKGTIINFKDTVLIQRLRQEFLEAYSGEITELVAETNLYYDVDKTYIGMHGDSERRIVICVRLGASLPLHYQWHYKTQPIGKMFSMMLNHGDIYIMSEKAVGNDWKKRNTYTLRHAAGKKNVLKL